MVACGATAAIDAGSAPRGHCRTDLAGLAWSAAVVWAAARCAVCRLRVGDHRGGGGHGLSRGQWRGAVAAALARCLFPAAVHRADRSGLVDGGMVATGAATRSHRSSTGCQRACVSGRRCRSRGRPVVHRVTGAQCGVSGARRNRTGTPLGALPPAHCGSACAGAGTGSGAHHRRPGVGLARVARAGRTAGAALDRQGPVAEPGAGTRGASGMYRAGGAGMGAWPVQAGHRRAGQPSGGLSAVSDGADHIAGAGLCAGARAAHARRRGPPCDTASHAATRCGAHRR